MTYRILSAIGDHYQNETKKPVGEREDFLNDTAKYMRGALALLEEYKRNGLGPKVASDLPREGRTKALAAFHEQQIANVVAVDQTIERFKYNRLMLLRSGAQLTADGFVAWPKVPVTVQYDKDLEAQETTKLQTLGGFLYTSHGKPFDTRPLVTAHSGYGYAIYVMSAEGNFHVSSHSVGLRHHSSLLAGEMVAGAGEMQVISGKLTYLSNKSGHYQPDMNHFLQTLNAIDKAQIPLDFEIELWPGNQRFHGVDHFMKEHGWDNDSVEWSLVMIAYSEDVFWKFVKERNLFMAAAGAYGPKSRAGPYDLSVTPPRRMEMDELERELLKWRGDATPAFLFQGGEKR